MLVSVYDLLGFKQKHKDLVKAVRRFNPQQNAILISFWLTRHKITDISHHTIDTWCYLYHMYATTQYYGISLNHSTQLIAHMYELI